MIVIKTADGKFFFSTFVNLREEEQAEVDETVLTLQELQYIVQAADSKRIIVTTEDMNKVKARIAALSSSGEIDPAILEGKEDKTNKADEVGEGSDTEYPTTNAVKEYINEELSPLAQVAFSGSYLDLKDRPTGGGGDGEPFSVIDWNPYRTASVEKVFTPGNSSTGYSNGVITKLLPDSLAPVLIDVGYPQSPEISVVNGTDGAPLVITVDPEGPGQLSKTLALSELKSIAIKATDVFPHDNQQKGALISFFIIQLEEGEDITTMNVQQIVTKPRNISVNFNSVYLNEYNTFTNMSYNITVNGNNAGSDQANLNGSFDMANFKIENNRFTMGGGLADINLVEVGFNPEQKYAALFLIQADTTPFDVKTPFHLEVSQVSAAPELDNVLPDEAEIVVKPDSEILFAFENQTNSDYFSLSLLSNFNEFNYGSPETGQVTIEQDTYLDSNGNLTFRIVNGNQFQIKNHVANVFFNAYTSAFPLNSVKVITMSAVYGNPSKTTWNFTVNKWSKIEVLNGILPDNAIDGSTLRVTHNGKFNDVNLVVDDIVNPYDNKTKLVIHRNGQEVSNDVETAGNLPVSGNAVKAYSPTASSLAGISLEDDNGKLEVKVSTIANNLIQTNNSGIYVTMPSILTTYATREAVYNSNYESSVQLGLGIRNIFTINYPGGSVNTYFTNLSDYDFNNTNTAISKTITIIIINAAAVTWPSEIIWADGTPPTIEPNKYLVVNGIHVKSGIEETTSGKVLCSYSYYNR